MNASQILQQLMQSAAAAMKAGDAARPAGGAAGLHGRLSDLVQRSGLSGGLGGAAADASAAGAGRGAPDVGWDVKSLLGGGAAGTALGLLLGSKKGRKLGASALKYGALAGAGVLAWKAWQARQAHRGADGGVAPGAEVPTDVSTSAGPSASASAATDRPIEQLAAPEREARSLELLHAMISAARADGHIDDQERALLEEQIVALGADPELRDWVAARMREPLDAVALARSADSPQAAREMYLVSRLVADDAHPMARAWLEQLAEALGLDAATRAAIEAELAGHAGDVAVG